MEKLKQIKENFENKKYSLLDVPSVFVADWEGVNLYKVGRHQDEIESLEDIESLENWERDEIPPKLKFGGHGDYEIYIRLIGTQYFDSHEKLDTLYNDCWDPRRLYWRRPPVKKYKILLEDAMNFHSLKISCDMDYYLTNREEMEKDLGRSLDGLDLGDGTVLEQLEKELFHNQIIQIFGDSEDENDGAIVFDSFHILFEDGNDMFATAKRGNYFWIIHYSTS